MPFKPLCNKAVLIQSLKPEFTKIFCELEAQQKNEQEPKSETVKIEDKVA